MKRKIDLEWRAIRAQQLIDHPECKACGATEGLIVHHAARRQGVGRKSDDGPLWTLCWMCHREVHDQGRRTFCEKYGLEDE